ncbi:Fe2+-dependent dioxygenase [Paucibacter sp. DJ2R-2]|uniref:Fe2+-dependent dioxygenase n=1 Tax=Paucibacter sp. DJ2R-2 TaxID=2893558 RepID=UPI0021E3A1EB|nr:Fe2+-dependent dioxygenase [Paucibacter sp. DJ2R-2]MCV2419407.1 Fe2+-dependent dioxygenase [Paucibacter sp. DJ4R-1]MCV2437689.1 Fe2+-dependent dioxygenase [Paucibacter sp. DJ2R-2]
MLLKIAELLSPADLEQARSLLDQADWQDGRNTAGAQAAQVKNNQQLLLGSESARALQALLLKALEGHATFFSAALPKRLLPPMFNRYAGEANTYGNHIDQAIRYVPGTGQRVRTDISCTVFLSGPEEYEGGELVIADTYGEQRVKLAAGDAVLYPGTSVHRVEPVTRGARLASFFWIESMVRSDEQRRLLFEMDQALMQLRSEHGDGDAAVQLTGTYHNLLRMWADT